MKSLWIVVACCLFAAACGSSTGSALAFDDHTVGRIDSDAHFDRLARSGDGRGEVVKFTIANFQNEPTVRFMDSNFYTLHDEWYWFRLLNGQPVAGTTESPAVGLSFPTVDAVYDFVADQGVDSLPLDMRVHFQAALGIERLSSNVFYRLALDGDERTFVAGSLVRFSADDRTRWLFELEFSDRPSAQVVENVFAQLRQATPHEIADDLAWVVRSPAQQDLADALVAAEHPDAANIVRYADLVPPGEVEVYNPGITAGRLMLVGEGAHALTDAGPTDIVILDDVPDELPTAAALITASPQTPLAHVNLLARNRGVPNLSISGVTDNAAVTRAAIGRAYAVLLAASDGTAEVVLVDKAAYDAFSEAQAPALLTVANPRSAGTPVLDLQVIADRVIDETDLARWRPLIGGKATGMVTLLNSEAVPVPPAATAISVELYFEHLATLDDALDEMLSLSSFEDHASIRYLFLEGPDAHAERYVSAPEVERAERLRAQLREGSVLDRLLDAGGVKRMIRDLTLDTATASAIERRLATAFADLAPSQGLRFRSSATVEDIEGFTGAGLYDSNTGWLDVDFAPDDAAHKTVEWALKKTWASYWSFEAFEERRIENVDHRSGGMAVLVHPRFDDDFEENNGVATVTVLREAEDPTFVVDINVQDGATSVANPSGSELPEVLRVTLDGADTTVERLAASTQSPNAPVLDDAAATELAGHLATATQQWFDEQNAVLDPEQQRQAAVLDFEFKTMADGWANREAGLVIKQLRSLEPGLRLIPAELHDLPLRRDVLVRARRIERVGCDGDQTVYEVLTDPLVSPDLGHTQTPLEVRVDGTGVFDAACRAETVYATGDDLLLDLLETGDALSIVG